MDRSATSTATSVSQRSIQTDRWTLPCSRLGASLQESWRERSERATKGWIGKSPIDSVEVAAVVHKAAVAAAVVVAVDEHVVANC